MTISLNSNNSIHLIDSKTVTWQIVQKRNDCVVDISATAKINPCETLLTGINLTIPCGAINAKDTICSAFSKLQCQITNISTSGVLSVTDDGSGVVVVNNTDPQNPIVGFGGVNVDGITITGDGSSGSPLVSSAGAPFITSIADTNTIDLNQALGVLTANLRYVDSVDFDLSDSAAGFTGVLTTTGVVAATYGDATNVAQFTVDAKGRLSFAQNVPIGFSTVAWLLNGNTVGSLQWIGTIDNFDFPIRTNSIENARVFATGQTGFGITASPLGKVHIRGIAAGYALYTETNAGAFQNWSIRDDGELRYNTGRGAFINGNSPSSTYFGFQAGINMSNGNTAFGCRAFSGTGAGVENVAMGGESGFGVTSGEGNVFYGYNTGNAYTTANGANRVAITTGFNNTFIGQRAGANSASRTASIALGCYAMTTADNQMVIGGTADALASYRINDVYIGQGVSLEAISFGQSSINIQTTGISAGQTDISAAPSFLALCSAIGTGTGIGGDIRFYSAPAGSTGTARNTLFRQVDFRGDGRGINVYQSAVPLTPSVSVTDGWIMYSNDHSGAGTASPFFRTENGTVIDLAAIAGGTGIIPAGTTGQTLYYAANGTVVTANSNIFNDVAADIIQLQTASGLNVQLNGFTDILVAGGSVGMEVNNSTDIVTVGDYGNTGNFTIIRINEAAATILYDSDNGHTFTGNVGIQTAPTANALEVLGDTVLTGKLTVTGAIDPTHLYLDEQAGDPSNVANKGILYTKDVGALTQLFYMDSAGTVKNISATGVGTVTSVSGTANRITSTGGATPVIDISASYVGQTSITTLGIITTGTLSTGAVIAGVTMTLGSDATGDIYHRSAGGVLTRLADVATGNALVSGGVGVAPSWGKIALTTHVSGVLPEVNGGTNQSTYALGDTLYSSATNVLSKLAGNITVNRMVQVQVGNGAVSAAPAWEQIPIGILSCPMGNGNTVLASTTNYVAFFFGGSNSTSEALRSVRIPHACTIKNLAIRTSNTQSATGNMVVTVRKNVAPTAITLTIAAGQVAGTFTDLVNTETFAAGDLISVQLVNNATAASANIAEVSCGMYL